MKFNFRSQKLLKNPGEPTAGSHLLPTTNGKVESPKEGIALILVLFLYISFPFCLLRANQPPQLSYIHCLPRQGLVVLSLLL